jgi:hypothetical protein
MNLLRRLLAYLSASPGGVREDHIAADDRLLSVLGSRDASAVGVVSDPLVRLLLSWRADIEGVQYRAGA